MLESTLSSLTSIESVLLDISNELLVIINENALSFILIPLMDTNAETFSVLYFI